MTVRELREKAAAAITAAEAVKKEVGTGEWTAEKQAQFDVAFADFTKFHKEADAQEAREAQMAELASARETYNRPVNQIPVVDPNAAATEQQSAARRATVREAFDNYLRRSASGLFQFAERQKVVAPQEIHALLSSDDTLGGFLVPDDFRAELLKAMAGFAAIRPLARTVTTTRDSVVWPRLVRNATDSRRTSGFAGQFQTQGYVTGGTAPTTQNQPTFAQERIPVHDWQPKAIELSPQLLEDSAIDVTQVIAQLVAETLAFDEDDKFLSGTGVNEPEGILTAGITTVNTGSASALAYNGLVDLYMNCPPQYRQNGTWMMKSLTYGKMLQLLDSQNRPLFGLNAGNTTPVVNLWGRPIVFHENMDAVAAGNKPIIFGDIKQLYLIVDRQELRVQRLTERYAPNVGFLPVARIGGQVINIDAARVQNVSA